MRVFVTGASGFVGSAVVRELLSAGHEVVGLARSDQSAAALTSAGARPHRGDLADLDSLRQGAAASDGVIHCGYVHDFTDLVASARIDRQAIETLGETLAGSDRPLVVSAAITSVPGRAATEADEAPEPTVNPRASEQAALPFAERDVRVSVLRLPVVHGEDDRGFVPYLIQVARDKSVSAYLGDGTNRWPAVHRLDAARLFRLALEEAPAGTRLHAVADEGVPFRELAGVIGKHLDVRVTAIAPEQAQDHFGWMALFASLDSQVTSTLTRKQLSWKPEQPGLIADLDAGHYFAG